ncbi:hypothetical protein ACTXJX_14930 [Glutamicibacter ardleyensis]|uniref:hypothetical protein n=1 Tax=Glutamicibacter ardleyensis TaxID=225894 RepID=UPI003FCEEEAD
MTENFSPRLDTSSAQIIEQYTAKAIDEDTARALLYRSVVQSNVCAGIIVSTSVPGVDRQWLRNRREDFQSEVHRLIHDKLVSETGAEAFFDFSKSPTSMTGWVRQFLRVAYPRMAHDLYQKERRQLPTEDAVLASLSNTSRTITRDTEYFTDAECERQRIEEISDEYMRISRGVREFKKAEVRAQAIMDGLDVPATVRPRGADRLSLYRKVAGDVSLCEKSAKDMLNVLRNRPQNFDCDERLLALWDDYSVEKLQILIRAGNLAIRAMVLKALADYSVVNMRRQKLFVSSVKNLGDRSGRWATLAESIVQLFIAEETHPLFHGETEEEIIAEKRKVNTFRKAILPKGDEIYSVVAKFKGNPLGATSEDVRQRLYSIYVGTEAKHRSKSNSVSV